MGAARLRRRDRARLSPDTARVLSARTSLERRRARPAGPRGRTTVIGRRVLLGATAAMLAAAPRTEAQFYFGQNQVQYDSFDWKVVETDHFLVHYYAGEETAARDAARMAERAYG